VVKNYIGNGYELKIKRLDNSIITFSWVSCCTNNFITNYDLLNAMRYCIKKNNKVAMCENCKLNNNKINICYCYKIKFKQIVNNFLKLNKNFYNLPLTKHHKTNIIIFEDGNLYYENKWINYHNKLKQFKILCNNCLSCPKCKLWIKYGKLCAYCEDPNLNKKIMKTKEYKTIQYIKKKLPNYNFIYDGKSIGNVCHKNDKNEKMDIYILM
jgi:hypothetical protein